MKNAELAWSVADAEEQPAFASEADNDPELPEEPVSFADEAHPEPAEALCPACGELLAWHDEFASCRPAGAALAGEAAMEAAEVPDEYCQEPAAADQPEQPRLVRQVAGGAGQASFAYKLGRRVQPTPTLTAQVIWRGQLKERHPATGLVHRVNVYRLNDGYWDCYREEELRAA